MKIRARVAIPFLLLSIALAPSVASADEAKPSDTPGAPIKIKIASTESAQAGKPDDPRTAFTLVRTDQGACYAVEPPGGEGMAAGESYVVVAATEVDDTLRKALSKQHADCTIVDVVAREAL